MTLQEIKRTVKAIDDVQSDPEVAHGLEDTLFENFTRHVAKMGDDELQKMARAVLKSKKIDFPRWMA